mgnify:CR=1 FL=1
MKYTIYKYELMICQSQIIHMPKGAEILTIQVQRSKPQLWVLINCNDQMEASRAMVKRKICIEGTGHKIASYPGAYINTFQISNGDLVYHVFDGGEE